ncbi:spliceosome-associated protein 130 A-like [Impatiens glandulifera]|uniref:spliceosome-associated protein 130 A-like n=1 Tax=Impatiens glandulifera TaxID=253017 RepID=UPI001FB060E9|nr:spliceosome-associated protein 130 A-like [Impatiens glandulifera]
MYLYNLTLQQASGIVCAVTGNFSGGPTTNTEEIVVARGKILDLLRLDEKGNILKLLSVEVFGYIRSLAQFRLPNADKDYIIIGSDSGRMVILEYNKEDNVFHKIQQQILGRTGCLRTVPGQYLAIEPYGRAVMIGACEEQKLVFLLTRGDKKDGLTIYPPIHVHNSKVLCYSICGVDRGFCNPIFAAIELDYNTEAAYAQKCLVFYELDLEHTVVSRRWFDQVDNDANMLLTVPGGADGPSGVLVCAENFVIYKNQGHPDVRGVIPRREDLSANRGSLIVSAVVIRKQSVFFFLLQTEYGDIFKVTLDHENDTVKELRIKYFDTIPVSSSLCLLKSDFLFSASEIGNHGLYRFNPIGEFTDVESSSNKQLKTSEGFHPLPFQPRKLKNLLRVNQAQSLMPIIDMKVDNLYGEIPPHIFTLCGSGPRSTLKILRPGLAVREIEKSYLHEVPTAIWTVKKNVNDEFDAYIVVSFAQTTIMFSVGEITEQVRLTGFLENTPSLVVSLIGNDTLMQVYSGGIRQIKEQGLVDEWLASKKRRIVKVVANRLQVIIALNGGKLKYFEVGKNGQLNFVNKKKISGTVGCLAIAPVPEGKKKSRFFALGSCDRYDNNRIYIFSLEPKHCMKLLSLQSIYSLPESLIFLDDTTSLFLNAGLENGVLFRTGVNPVSGQLDDTRYQPLGINSPKLLSIVVGGIPAVLCLSNRSWLGFVHQGVFILAPLSYESFKHAASFSSDQCREGVVGVNGAELRIFVVQKLGDQQPFNQISYPLRYTPRKVIIHQQQHEQQQQKMLVIIEREKGVINAEDREYEKNECFEVASWIKESADGDDEEDMEDPFSDEQFGYPKVESDKWVSCIRILDPKNGDTTCLVELEDDEAAFSICTVKFKDDETVLAVGTGIGPKEDEVSGGYIHIYRFVDWGKKIELLHKTEVDNLPLALCEFEGKLLAGVGKMLRLYDLGETKLLRQCGDMFPCRIKSIQVYRDRFYVCDDEVGSFFRYCKYLPGPDPGGNQLYMFGEDSIERCITASHHIDIDTMVGADRLGNVFFLRLPTDVSAAIEKCPYGDGTPNKIDEIVHFHVGDVITCLQKTTLTPDGKECVLYGTIMGSLGALHAFSSRDDVDFFSRFEIQMRQVHSPLCGRDHLTFRSSYFTVKNVIDGDLCEQFPTLPLKLRRKIAREMDITQAELLRKLEAIRNKII